MFSKTIMFSCRHEITHEMPHVGFLPFATYTMLVRLCIVRHSSGVYMIL